MYQRRISVFGLVSLVLAIAPTTATAPVWTALAPAGVTWTAAGGGLPSALGPRALLGDPATPDVFYAAFCARGGT